MKNKFNIGDKVFDSNNQIVEILYFTIFKDLVEYGCINHYEKVFTRREDELTLKNEPEPKTNVDVMEVIDQLIADISNNDLSHYLNQMYKYTDNTKDSSEIDAIKTYTECVLKQIFFSNETISKIEILKHLKEKIELIS